MKKDQFLKDLRNHLTNLRLPQTEINDILRDQEEYIRDAVQAGRNEEQVVTALGDPKIFAAGLTADLKIQKAENSKSLKTQTSSTFGAVFAILALAPLNLIFVLGPFIGLVGLTFAGWAVAAAVAIASFAIFIAFFFKLVFVSVGIWMHLSAFFFCLGCIGASILALYLMAEFTRFLLKWTLAYLKWNLSFIQTQF